MSDIIKCSADCNVRIFMAAMFNKDFTSIDEYTFEKVHTEFIDLSGIGNTREYELMTAIHNLGIRIITISWHIDAQRKAIAELGIPFVPAFKDFSKYGHRLKWNGNRGDFLAQIRRVDLQERKFNSELADSKKKLENLQKNGVQNDVDSRKEFIKTLNRLGKDGYKIDKDQTMVEELALMIHEYNDDQSEKINKK